MSTIVGSTSEESGFVNVMKILEEERYCMERRLDLITKVTLPEFGSSLFVSVTDRLFADVCLKGEVSRKFAVISKPKNV